jgi:phosphatidylglycerol:prolipoprotein diacylglycerol transferase
MNTIEFPNAGLFFTINNVAFSLFADVYWYGIIICAAVVLGIMYGVKSATRAGLLPELVFDAAFAGVICGVIGARLYFVIFSERSYTLQSALNIRDGGLAIYGGVIGAIVGLLLTARFTKRRFKLAPFFDLLGLGFLIGHSIGRWGNFFNQEAFGAPTAGELPWGMTGSIIAQNPQVAAAQAIIPDGGLALVHPCFLYESLWCAVGFVFLHFYMRKWRTFDGEVFLLYVFWYGLGRAWIESLRMDSLMAGDLRVSQLLAVISASAALLLFVYCKLTKQQKHGYVMYKDIEANREAIVQSQFNARVRREKERAKSALKRTRREIHDPFAESIIGDEGDD